jgi:hypothetical protein
MCEEEEEEELRRRRWDVERERRETKDGHSGSSREVCRHQWMRENNES